MRPGSRESCEAQSIGGAKPARCGAIMLTSVGKVAGIAQGAAHMVMQS